MNRIKVGIIGMGFIGMSHVEAIRRIGCVELRAVADENYELAKDKAEPYGIPVCYRTAEELIEDEEIQVVHNCTPNHLHLAINEQVIHARKHIFSEKPLGKNAAESRRMLELLEEYPEVIAGVNFCYRMNPLLQDARHRIAAGEIGKPYLVHGSYLQDWLLYETDYNWRVEREKSGASRCVGDIGSHWMDTAQTLVGSRITDVCANVVTAIPVRKKPTRPVETFSLNTDAETVDVPVDTEDYAGVLIKFENGASGVFQCSQISAGRKCFIEIEIDGSRSSLEWQHQLADHMWKGNRDKNNEEILRNPNLMMPQARKYTYLGAGHPEGWNDAFKNNLQAFYDFIHAGKRRGEPCDFATFEEGHYMMRLIEAILESGKSGRWIHLDP